MFLFLNSSYNPLIINGKNANKILSFCYPLKNTCYPSGIAYNE